MSGRRLLVVVAHPDDETFGCGSLLLHAVAQGFTTTVCCATRGEAGEVAPGSGVEHEELGIVREAELRAAADMLGVAQVSLLGFRDSGMDGPPPPDSLVATPLLDVATAVREVIEHTRPHVVVTLAADDGHRDHAHTRHATLAAVDAATWRTDHLYVQCLPRRLLRRWADHEQLRRPDSPYLDVDAAGLGTPEEELTTILDTTRHLDACRRAIACHRSQSSPYAGVPPELEVAFLGAAHLVRVRPVWNGHHVETELPTAALSHRW